MADTASVPLMMDMEGGEPTKGGVETGLEKDFNYNNNVAGASKHIRLGEFNIILSCSRAFANIQVSFFMIITNKQSNWQSNKLGLSCAKLSSSFWEIV